MRQSRPWLPWACPHLAYVWWSIGDGALLSTIKDNDVGSTHEEWLRVMRQKEGLPDPKPIGVEDVDIAAAYPLAVAEELSALTSGGSPTTGERRGSSDSVRWTPLLGAEQQHERHKDPRARQHGYPPGPPSPALGSPCRHRLDAHLGQDPYGDGDEAADNLGPDNTAPSGPMAKYWRRHSDVAKATDEEKLAWWIDRTSTQPLSRCQMIGLWLRQSPRPLGMGCDVLN